MHTVQGSCSRLWGYMLACILETSAHHGAQPSLSQAHHTQPHTGTFKWALQLLAPAVQVAAGTEEATDGGGNHGHEEDDG